MIPLGGGSKALFYSVSGFCVLWAVIFLLVSEPIGFVVELLLAIFMFALGWTYDQ